MYRLSIETTRLFHILETYIAVHLMSTLGLLT